jgi:hypothetical protein
MAANAAFYTSIPLCWGGLPEGPRYGISSWGGLRPQRYVFYLFVVIYDILVHMFDV